MSSMVFHHDFERGIDALSQGRPVLIGGEDVTGYRTELVIAAAVASARSVAFLVRHSSGFLRVVLPEDTCRRLRLPPMPGTFPGRPNLRVSVDAAHGSSTGISARDRALTARLLASPDATVDDFSRPGHVVPCAIEPHRQPQHEELAATLAHSAGLAEAAMLGTLEGISNPLASAGRADTRLFAHTMRLPLIEFDPTATDPKMTPMKARVFR